MTAEATKVRPIASSLSAFEGWIMFGKPHERFAKAVLQEGGRSPCSIQVFAQALNVYPVWILSCILQKKLFKIEPWNLSAKELKAWKLFGPISHYSLGKTDWIRTC